MNPQAQFCPNEDCTDRGKIQNGNIVCHSRQEKRYKCKTCQKTFSETTGTALYGIKKKHDVFICVVTLLAFGCPIPAIVMAFGLDERTVRTWLHKAGQQCEQVHQQIIGQSQLDLQQVQADEIKIKGQGQTWWMALAMMVSTRLWLGGVVQVERDKKLIRELVQQVRRVALCRDLLLMADGLVSYVKAFQQAFRSPLKTGQQGRPRLIAWTSIHIGQVIKRRQGRHLTVERRLVQGTATTVQRLLTLSQGGGVLNTAYIERLNATFRQRLWVLTRRTRHLAQQVTTLHTGMFLVGTVYNFCVAHHSLRLKLFIGERSYRWVQRTPALTAGLTDHFWSVEELMSYKIPLPPYVPPKRRGRPPKHSIQEASL